MRTTLAKKKRTIRAWTNQEFRDLKKFAKDKVPVPPFQKR
jgi:serine/threonine-protein kinase RIO1